jgi:hypothetical protein
VSGGGVLSLWAGSGPPRPTEGRLSPDPVPGGGVKGRVGGERLHRGGRFIQSSNF